MKNPSTKILILAVSILFSVLITSCKDGPENLYASAVVDENCPKPLAWLEENPIPEPNYAVFPCGYTLEKDSSGKPSVSNMAFHEISWQYFLWLTEEVTEGSEKMLRFESMYSDAAINIKDPNDPKGKEHILGGIQQAGSNSVLVDENKRAVYTTMMIDSVYRNFVVKNELNIPEKLRDFPAKTNFPDGAMSMKAAWKIVPKGKKAPKGAYTRTSKLYTVVEIDGNLTTSDNYRDTSKRKTIEETVALVGFHIAVVVKGHPEFIWATFEHNDNTINYSTINQNAPPSYTFFNSSSFNVSNTGALSVDPKTQIISQDYVESPTTQTLRIHQYGGGDAQNQNNIASLNETVHKSLDATSMWQNYHEVGAVWFNQANALIPDWSLTTNPNLETGSKTLSNSVIETFTQDAFSQNSCFSCHNTTQHNTSMGIPIDGKNVLTSHILLKNYENAQSDSPNLKVVNRNK
jgi:hypothetical protein